MLKKLFVLFLLHSFLFAETPHVLQFSDFPEEMLESSHPLWQMHGQRVKIRGFWYPLSPEQGYLAASPQLKSCCLGAPTKIYQQLIVKGNIATSSYQHAMTLEGIFKIEPLHSSEGKTIQYYLLEKAQEIDSRRFSNLSLITVCAGGLLLGLFWFNRKQG